MCSLSTSSLSPSRDSTIRRYSQPAEPVYQVQPPRPMCGEVQVPAPLGQGGEPFEHVVKEESQPHTFALALGAHAAHAVVPVADSHQGQAMVAEAKPVHDGTGAVRVQGLLERDMQS